MDAAAQSDGLADALAKGADRESPCDADLGAHLPQRRLRAGPDDVLDGEVVAVKGGFARLGIQQTRDARHIEAEVVAERGVLTEVVGVVGIIVGGILVAREQDQALADFAAELVAALLVRVG